MKFALCPRQLGIVAFGMTLVAQILTSSVTLMYTHKATDVQEVPSYAFATFGKGPTSPFRFHGTNPPSYQDIRPDYPLWGDFTVSADVTNARQSLKDVVDLQSSSIPSLCWPWSINTDDWWVHHPTYTISLENDTHYCFDQAPAAQQAQVWQGIYRRQFLDRDCSLPTPIIRKMWSSGWGADWFNYLAGLMYAAQTNQPVAFTHIIPWHYALPKKGKVAACAAADESCYFLPISPCPPIPMTLDYNDTDVAVPAQTNRWYQTDKYDAFYYYQYATRPQTWLRKRVYDFVQQQSKVTGPCTVLHVRRGDVVLHADQSRKYFAIAEYLQHVETNEIILLTDDANAVDEALNYTNYTWHYIDRPRFKGAEGGFENQIPSQDAVGEVVTMLGTFQWIQQCQALIRTDSGFANVLHAYMGSDTRVMQLDRLEGAAPIRSRDYYQRPTNSNRKRKKSLLSTVRRTRPR